MRNNMLVNVSGLAGHAMPIDLNIEHLIGELKVRMIRRRHFLKLTLCRVFYKLKDFSQPGIASGTYRQHWTF